MNCEQAYRIITEGEGDCSEHLSSCPDCMELYQRVNDAMKLMDPFEDVPDHLVQSILEKKNELGTEKTKFLSLSNYIQIAAAVIFGIFIGHKAGEGVDTGKLRPGSDPVSEYIEAHHMNINPNDLGFTPLQTKN